MGGNINLKQTSFAGIHSALGGLADIDHLWAGTKTIEAWNKSIGAAGDYADWATMAAAMPDLIAHPVTVTIEAGTRLAELCEIKNKHALTAAATITIQAEKYYPISGVIPTADSATATTLRDAALAAEAYGNDYFNGCWILIVHGTGTDNGFVPIIDYVDATGDVVVANWPGTQPNNTSRYMIVGALIDGENTRNGLVFRTNTCQVRAYGIGVDDANENGILFQYNYSVGALRCAVYGSDRSGINAEFGVYALVSYCGSVKNNTDNNTGHAGVKNGAVNFLYVNYSALSDNNRRGILSSDVGYTYANNNFGDGNGLWGSYALYSGQLRIAGTQCSGSSGLSSDPGTAGANSQDQAAVF